jgi:hypothetical protein
MKSLLHRVKELAAKLVSFKTFGKRDTTYVLKVLGLSLIYGFHGNCIYPVIHLHRTGGVNRVHLTIRTSLRHETTIYVRKNFSIDWNCEWIARRFGQCIECDFGDVYQYSGILGNHTDI